MYIATGNCANAVFDIRRTENLDYSIYEGIYRDFCIVQIDSTDGRKWLIKYLSFAIKNIESCTFYPEVFSRIRGTERDSGAIRFSTTYMNVIIEYLNSRKKDVNIKIQTSKCYNIFFV